ncbi:2Fe-2S iron-sulfur cluster-binding protein [Streptomyces sp. NPDC005209]|uniref:2Fe-2S iron-sulfur cluster-binding protein n=1 Tax=Streptomyces sp. NPDC005209 TaxID=3156715 RepID=UPI0033A90716
MTDDQHGDGTSRGRWDPLPQGDYDDGATAFVKLPEGGIDALLAADSPLAAPGHGYVPPQITVAPATNAGTDPAATGTWTMPTDGTQWPDPNAVPQDAGADDRFTYHPAATQQWTFEEPAPAPAPAPGHDVTGQWSIPVAGGDLPDESGEFTTSSLVEQWGGTPPATLPGGASAPWATEPADRPWDHRQTGPGTESEAPAGHPRAGGRPADTRPGEARTQEHAPAPGADRPGTGAPFAGGYPEPPTDGDTGTLSGHATGTSAGQNHDTFAGRSHDTLGGRGSDTLGGQRHDTLGGRGSDALAGRNHDTPAGQSHDTLAGQGHDTLAGRSSDTLAGRGGVAAGHPVHEADAARESAEDAESGEAFAPGEADAARGAEEAPEGPSGRPTDPDATPDAELGPEAGETAATDAESDDAAGSVPPHDDHPLAAYVLRVNGVERPVSDAWIGESLLYVLRERLGLAGAKDGCSQGECGACNVQVDGRLVASCLVPAVTAAGSEVRTVEGLADDGQPSDVQRALAKCGAVQCGFCVPGMAMTVHDLLEGNPAPTELEARQALCGNLCRCSGYRGVLDAVQEVVAEREAHAAADAETDADGARIPHQAAPGAGGVNPSAFEAHGSPVAHDRHYGQDGGQA